MNDIIGSGQIQANAARLQANQKQCAFAALKRIDPLLTLFRRRRAIQILIADTALFNEVFDQLQMIDKLAEYQSFVFVV